MTEIQEQELIFSQANGDHSDFNEAEITTRYFASEPEGISIESICGTDSRVKVTATSMMPYKAICKLYIKFPSGKNYIGTGFLTHQNKLYTAGHCVYDRDFGAWMQSIIVVPGKSGLTEPYSRYYASELSATRGWIENGSHRYDMGAIKLSSNVNHNDMFLPTLADPNTGEVCGYPADRDTGIFQYKMADTLSKSSGQFKYLVDTFGGQSGSPLLQGSIKAVGIHNYGGCPNCASDLYQNFIDEIHNW